MPISINGTTAKIIPESVAIHVYPSSAEAECTYVVDLGKPQASPAAAGHALNYVPQIGDNTDFPELVPAAPFPAAFPVPIPGTRVPKGFTSFSLRCEERHPIMQADFQHVSVRLVYRSPPRSSISFDSILTQTAVTNYLDSSSTALAPVFKQMVIGTNKTTGNLFPTISSIANLPLPNLPASANVLQLGSTIRVSAMYWGFELAALDKLQTYANCYNSKPLLFANDAQRWLCTRIDIRTVDQWKFNVSAEVAYNPLSWDTILTYTDQFSGIPATLSQADINAAIKVASGKDGTAPPSFTAGDGVARYAQHYLADITSMIAVLAVRDHLHNIP